MKNIQLAQISPNNDAYSETFIQNHKLNFEANVNYYYGGFLPHSLEGYGYLNDSVQDRIKLRLKKLLKADFSHEELREKALEKSFRKNNIDIVFAEYGPTGVAVMNICKKLNLPLIVNFHGYDASMYEIISSYKKRYLQLFDYAYKIIGVSKTMVEKLKELGCPDEKLVYIPYGPDNRFLELTPLYSEKAFLAVGRFVDKKAPYYTLLAFKKVVDLHPDALLYMAGDGVLHDACTNICKYYNLDKNIIFLGKCSHEELLPYYSKVKAFVQHSITPSNGDMEGTPVSVLEASAAALPVISTRHAGIKDVIIEGEAGFLVDEHAVDLMAERMIYLLDNESLVRELGEAGRKNIRQHYTVEIQMDKINRLIKEGVS